MMLLSFPCINSGRPLLVSGGSPRILFTLGLEMHFAGSGTPKYTHPVLADANELGATQQCSDVGSLTDSLL